MYSTFVLALSWLLLHASADLQGSDIELSNAAIVTRDGPLPASESMAGPILRDEVRNRTRLQWPIHITPNQHAGPLILLANRSELPAWHEIIPQSYLANETLGKPESFLIDWLPTPPGKPAQLLILGGDSRGLMFGVGYFLRQMQWNPNSVQAPNAIKHATAPEKPLRGHQIGYRARANSWDAWSKEQMEQYFRELILFGANAIENIPFQDKDRNALMKYERDEMNLFYGELCKRYDLQHWVWIPIEFPANDRAQADAFLDKQAAFYKNCARLDAIFVPGGDPGDNPASTLLPYLERMAGLVRAHHPKATLWVSMQGWKPADIDEVYRFLDQHSPPWFGGVVMGPSSPSLQSTRQRLPAKYPLRWYPDITHNVRCQYPIPWLDPAWGLTIGREGINPRPAAFSDIYREGYRFTDGFISYSDGIHDDFNKQLWSQLAWDSQRSVRLIATEYARLFFSSERDEAGADALLSLETNLVGPIAANGSVEGTLLQWQQLEQFLQTKKLDHESKRFAWRFELHLMRAYYDAYIRRRQIYEEQLESLAINQLNAMPAGKTELAVEKAMQTLARADRCVAPLLRNRILELADSLFLHIGYQSSVPKYQASGHERSCMIDYLDYPLNNRWWIEDQLERVRSMAQDQQEQQLNRLIHWEDAGPDGFYEVLGHVGKSPHVPKLFGSADAMRLENQFPSPTQRNISPARRSLRTAWHSYLDVLPHLTFEGLDPTATYTIRLFAQRESPLMIDGVPAVRTQTGDTYEQVTEQWFAVPAEANRDGALELHWAELDQSHLNWREYHYVTDLWIIKQR